MTVDVQVQVQIHEKVAEIVNGVARKYGRAYGLNVEDLAQDLWVKLLECGLLDTPNPNFDLIAKTCFNRAVDIYRFERRRYDRKGTYESEEAVAFSASEVTSGAFSRNRASYRQPEKYIELVEMIELFEQGSRERKFVVAKAYYEGVISMREALEFEPSLTREALESLGDKEDTFAWILGLSACGSGSYRSLKRKIKARLQEYVLGR